MGNEYIKCSDIELCMSFSSMNELCESCVLNKGMTLVSLERICLARRRNRCVTCGTYWLISSGYKFYSDPAKSFLVTFVLVVIAIYVTDRSIPLEKVVKYGSIGAKPCFVGGRWGMQGQITVSS